MISRTGQKTLNADLTATLNVNGTTSAKEAVKLKEPQKVQTSGTIAGSGLGLAPHFCRGPNPEASLQSTGPGLQPRPLTLFGGRSVLGGEALEPFWGSS